MSAHPVKRPTDAAANGEHYVYRIYAREDLLLYIGVTSDVEHRIYMHRMTDVMVDADVIHCYYDHHTSTRYDSKAEAREAECQAIFAEAPLLNRQHNPKRWKKGRGGRFYPVAPADSAA